MAKGVILEDKITGGQILPVTSSDLVFDPVNNKTQKEFNDELFKEKAVLVKEVDAIKKITDSSFRIENKVLNGGYIVLNAYTNILPNKVDLIKNHKYYTIRKVELADGVTQGAATGRVAYQGSNFRLINVVKTDGKSGNIETFTDETVLDASITVYGSNSGDVYFSNFMIIDLTKAFGEGNEPTVEKMDALVDMVDGGYFENVLSNKYTLKWVQNELELKIEDVETRVESIENDLALKANHGYESNPKTLKEVDDDLAQLESDLSEYAKQKEVDVIKKITDSSFRIENKVLNGGYIVLNAHTNLLPNKVDLIKNHKYYTIRKIELANGATQNDSTGRVAYLGSNFRLINQNIKTDGESGNIETFTDETVLDASITVYGSNSGDVYFSNFMIIDLTEAFGEGNEPTVEEMDALVDMVDGGYFENVLPNKYTLKWVQNEIELKIEDVETRVESIENENLIIKSKVKNGNFASSLVNWSTHNASPAVGYTILTATDKGSAYILQIINNDVESVVYASCIFSESTLTEGVATLFTGGVSVDAKDGFTSMMTVVPSGESRISLDLTYATGSIKIENVVYLNLTEIFGKGDEPSKEEMDELMDIVPNYWINLDVSREHILDWQLRRLKSVRDIAENNRNKLYLLDETIDNRHIIENIVTNGDFSRGIEDWIISTATGVEVVSTDNNELVVYPGRYGFIGYRFGIIEGHKYYITSFIKGAYVRQSFYDTTGATILGEYRDASSFNKVSHIITAGLTAQNAMMRFHHQEENSTVANVHIKYAVIVDLTEAFGAGKEPTASYMDNILTCTENKWFDEQLDIRGTKVLDCRISKAEKRISNISPTGINDYTTVPIYSDGILTEIQELDDDVVMKSTALIYSSDGAVESVSEETDTEILISTINYEDGELKSITKEIISK